MSHTLHLLLSSLEHTARFYGSFLFTLDKSIFSTKRRRRAHKIIRQEKTHLFNGYIRYDDHDDWVKHEKTTADNNMILGAKNVLGLNDFANFVCVLW